MSYSVSGTTIYLTRGDTFLADIVVLQSDDNPYDFQEGDQLRFAMKKSIKDETCLLIKDIPTDTQRLTIEPEDTKELSFGTYVYDIQLTKANGDVDTFITPSKLILTEEVD